MKRLLQHIMRYFLPVLFISYMAGISLFAHVHVSNEGIVVHSHPFKKGAAHNHTTAEFHLIHFLSHFTTDSSGVACFLLLFVPVLLRTLSRFPQNVKRYNFYHELASLRAPPSLH